MNQKQTSAWFDYLQFKNDTELDCKRVINTVHFYKRKAFMQKSIYLARKIHEGTNSSSSKNAVEYLESNEKIDYQNWPKVIFVTAKR